MEDAVVLLVPAGTPRDLMPNFAGFENQKTAQIREMRMRDTPRSREGALFEGGDVTLYDIYIKCPAVVARAFLMSRAPTTNEYGEVAP